MATFSLDTAFAERFADEWISAWNAHDLERVLSHYTDDFEMSSPVIAQVTGHLDSRLRGKAAVRAYWTQALALFPQLRFELICTLLGVNSVALHYKGATGKWVVEVLAFNAQGQVEKAHAHYQA